MKAKTITESQQQYIIFFLGSRKFGVNITQTREILDSKNLTSVPDSPEFIRGIINLRGSVVPVIDLHVRLNVNQKKEDKNNKKIIIVELDGITAGMMVDDVKEIKGLTREEIVNLPELCKNVDSDYIEGVGRTDSDELLLLLDLAKILSRKEIKDLKRVDQVDREVQEEN
ncbi:MULTISPECIES: chemotaxis protein CheW [unclassified Halanaerobium]|uniref:chemotaxis protein CheW n=1 Tax=unclassified Halanaerobium TaxID=2641197 RepID=UPI000DF4A37C|nr:MULTISPECIES: chemotaxis protein CheW [unclassified Halanaerobium]RCW47702.1 purine-binding chemotaxis protein CheW [Halanaerobium sp. MA284_MarDTE_T2]RCW84654.1 purine-binding chemotaxis protein CheW [Halanaerobium sp. DL-01]